MATMADWAGGPPPNISVPPPNMAMPPPNMGGHHFNRFNQGGPPSNANAPQHRQHFFTPFRPYPRPGLDPEFDGKRLRKSVMRKTVDYNAAIIKMLETRVWQRDFRDRRALQPDVLYYPDMQPPRSYEDNPMNAVTTRFVKTATNKMRCPVFCMAWTPEGRRLVTGASSGEFTLWNGLTFNFETILQAHDSPVRTMVWSHNEQWMVTADHAGYVKYWQSNMNNVKMFQGHKEAVRGISFSPSDAKFATCSDDGTIRVWDFLRCHEERILRGHGADVKCVDWHPQKGLIVSGSKDNQQPVKLWDPKTGQSLATLHAHKSTVMDVKWNSNGNWLVTASRDHLLKLFDIRQLNQELQTFRGHKKESSSVAWHPYHEGLFASGGSDGAILFWHVGADKEVGAIEQAHDSIVWTLAWHPLGHILCSGSNDHTSKFWTRNRPGDQMRDKYNLNNMPAGVSGLEEMEQDDIAVIPGMGPEDRIDTLHEALEIPVSAIGQDSTIPGLDFDVEDKNKPLSKKVPYSKPIPRNFQAQWNDTARPNMDDENGEDGENGESADQDAIAKMIQQIVEKVPGVIPVSDLEPSALFLYGKVLPVTPDSVLARAISNGSEAIYRLINSGAIEDLTNDIAHDESTQYHHEDPAIDDELRLLKAYELPRRPPLLSTPNMPPQNLNDRGRPLRDKVRRSRNEDDDDDYRRSQDGQDDFEEDYYDDFEAEDGDAFHQRYLNDDEEIMYKSPGDQDGEFRDRRDFGDQDLRGPLGDKDMRQPAPSLLGVAPGVPGPGMPGAIGRPSSSAYMKDQDLRRPSMLAQGDNDHRQGHGGPLGMHLHQKLMDGGFGNTAGNVPEDRDYRNQGRQVQGSLPPSLLGHPNFGQQNMYDQDYRVSENDPRFNRRANFRGNEEFEDKEQENNFDPRDPRDPRTARSRVSRWGQSGRPEDGEDDDSGSWGPRSGGRAPMSRGMRPQRGGSVSGPGGGGHGSSMWDSKRGRGLLETPRGGLLATPVMDCKDDDDNSFHSQRTRWNRDSKWDDEAAPGEDGALEDNEDSEYNRSSSPGSYRNRGGWSSGSTSGAPGGGYPPRGMWGGPMRGRGRGGRGIGGNPRGARRPRPRN